MPGERIRHVLLLRDQPALRVFLHAARPLAAAALRSWWHKEGPRGGLSANGLSDEIRPSDVDGRFICIASGKRTGRATTEPDLKGG